MNHYKWVLICGIALVFTTGCWDRTEMNDLALILGWGMDYKNDGLYQATAQIVIPSSAQSGSQSGGAENNAYFTETAIGKDVTDAAQNIQTKLSRQIFASHRRDIFLGEKLAKHGLKDMMDEYTRNPAVRLRTDVFVVKNGTANKILQITQPLEKVPAIAALKLHQQIGGLGDVSLANFLIDATSEGSSPTLPVMEIQKGNQGGGDKESFGFAGRAVFNNKLKLVGYLDVYESKLAFWVNKRSKFFTVTKFIPQGGGEVSLDLEKLKTRIKPKIQGKKIMISVNLIGEGMIVENNTNLDLSKTQNINLVERVLKNQCEKDVIQVITKVQKDYKSDIFGFGKTIHRKDPSQWKTLKNNWSEEFSKADVTVSVKLNIKSVGLTKKSFMD